MYAQSLKPLVELFLKILETSVWGNREVLESHHGLDMWWL